MKHQICRTVLAVAAVTAGVFLSACGLFRTPADNVFDEAEDAIAPDEAASNIKTAQIEYEFGDGDSATIRFQAPDKVRIDVLDDEDSAVFCLNGKSGWMYVRGEVIDMTKDDIKEMHGALLQTIPFKVDFQEIFTDATLLEETEDVCGEECDVIEAVFRKEKDIRGETLDRKVHRHGPSIRNRQRGRRLHDAVFRLRHLRRRCHDPVGNVPFLAGWGHEAVADLV